MEIHYIYLVQTRQCQTVPKYNDIYKLGKTCQDPLKRVSGYPKGCMKVFILQVDDCHKAEADLLKIFKTKFIVDDGTLENGKEYFRGDKNRMLEEMYNYISSSWVKVTEVGILPAQDILHLFDIDKIIIHTKVPLTGTYLPLGEDQWLPIKSDAHMVKLAKLNKRFSQDLLRYLPAKCQERILAFATNIFADKYIFADASVIAKTYTSGADPIEGCIEFSEIVADFITADDEVKAILKKSLYDMLRNQHLGD